MKTILALILLATIAHSAVVEDDALDFPRSRHSPRVNQHRSRLG